MADRDDTNARISLTGFEPGTCELADLSFRPGGVAGLEPGQALEEKNVPVLRHDEMRLTRAARRDFADFLWDTERDYWWGMHRYLKDELGVRRSSSGRNSATALFTSRPGSIRSTTTPIGTIPRFRTGLGT